MEKLELKIVRTCHGVKEYLLWEGALLPKSEIYSLPRHIKLELERKSAVSTERPRGTTAGSAKDWR